MDRLDLTVIVPFRDASQTLPRLLEGLARLEATQIILVDDASRDEGPLMAQRFAESHQKATLVTATGSGPGAARQTGLRLSEGRYVLFADADDEVDALEVDSLVAEFAESGKDLICAASAVLRLDDSGGRTATILQPPATLLGILRAPAVWAKLYRRGFLEDASISFPPTQAGEDVYFTWKVLKHKPQVAVSGRVIYMHYEAHDRQLTARSDYASRALPSIRAIAIELPESGVRGGLLGLAAISTSLVYLMRKTWRGRPGQLKQGRR